jgi:hypothetical protein
MIATCSFLPSLPMQRVVMQLKMFLIWLRRPKSLLFWLAVACLGVKGFSFECLSVAVGSKNRRMVTFYTKKLKTLLSGWWD